MAYHRFNNLDELINGDLAAKFGLGILSQHLMDRDCNCSLPSKVNNKFIYEGKCRNKFLIYKVKLLMCDAIYIGNTQQTLKKIMGSSFYDILLLIKIGQKSDSFAAHFEQHFKYTKSHTDLRNYNTFKVVKQINLIGAMKTNMKPN